MGFGTAPLLERRRVFHSRDVDETRAWLRGKEFRFDPLGRQTARPDVHMNGVYLPSLYLGYLQYGVKAMIRAAPARNDYWVQLPIRGSLDASFGGDTINCSPRRAVVLSPTRDDYYLMRSDAGGARIHVSINREALLRQLAALLGEPVEQPIEFDPTLALTSGYGRSLMGYLLMAVADFERSDATLGHAIMATTFEQLIMTGLLLAHPHACSERLRQREKPISPRDVKRAIDYMESNLDAPITLADIVQVSGIPGRTLFKHFQDWKGVSPMRTCATRDSSGHEKNWARAAAASVTDIAMDWGFSHMGRFSVEYRKRFGESPSIRSAAALSWRAGPSLSAAIMTQ
jgi:AraC-like DNA-binding protein